MQSLTDDGRAGVFAADQVPFKFTGPINKVAIRVVEEKLTSEDQREFEAIRGRGFMAG